MAAPRPLALALALAVAGALAYTAVVRGPGAGPFDAMPAGSFLVATLDVAALRASPLYGAIFDKGGGRREGTEGNEGWEGRLGGLGLGELALACGFDPLGRIDELDVAVPEGGEAGDFGVAASADLTREELVRCAENVAGARGEARKVEEIGRFHLIADDKGHALAVRDTGPIVVGRVAFVRAMIDAAERRAPSARANREHMELREALAPSGTRPLVLVTAILPGDLRERLKREMGAELGLAGSNAAMGGVLGVRAIGLSLRENDSGMLEAKAELRCDSTVACDEVRKLALAKRLALSQELALRLIGLGPAIDAFDAKAEGDRLTASTRARASDLGATLERIQKLRGRAAPPAAAGTPGTASPASPAPPAPPPRRPAPLPDEVLAARDAGPRDTSRDH